VGSFAVQLAKNIGATVIGIAGEASHQWLQGHGVIPVSYKGDIAENLKAALKGSKVDAFIDTSGKGYVEMAINMGIPVARIDTIIDFAAVEKYKVKSDGSSATSNVQVLQELADMVSRGEVEVPIANTYPLTQVREAYQELEQHHAQGKIILTVSEN